MKLNVIYLKDSMIWTEDLTLPQFQLFLHFGFLWIKELILLVTFKARAGQAPSYLSELLTSQPRPRGGDLLVFPKSRLKTKGDGAFSIRAPPLWNDLPEDIRHEESVSSFKSLLQTYFYRLAFHVCFLITLLFF